MTGAIGPALAQPGRYTTWQPDRQTIETAEGVVLAERRDPAAAFLGTTRQSPWDEFQVAYLAGEANWNYFTAPLIFARGDFVIEETWPWCESRQMLRTLLVTYLDILVAHIRQQTYYFDGAGLPRRLDYAVDILSPDSARALTRPPRWSSSPALRGQDRSHERLNITHGGCGSRSTSRRVLAPGHRTRSCAATMLQSA